MSGEFLHQSMMVAATCEARLVPSEFVPRVHLGHHQGEGGSAANAMESNLPGTPRHIMETTYHQVALGVQSLGSVVLCQLKGF
jgi:hypothetical protein